MPTVRRNNLWIFILVILFSCNNQVKDINDLETIYQKNKNQFTEWSNQLIGSDSDVQNLAYIDLHVLSQLEIGNGLLMYGRFSDSSVYFTVSGDINGLSGYLFVQNGNNLSEFKIGDKRTFGDRLTLKKISQNWMIYSRRKNCMEPPTYHLDKNQYSTYFSKIIHKNLDKDYISHFKLKNRITGSPAPARLYHVD